MKTEQVRIDQLRPNQENPRRITRAELNKLIRSIKEFGFVDPIIVNNYKDRKDIIIGGHQRVMAAKQMGYTTVPVVYVDLDEDREMLLNIALNEISGDWDEAKLYKALKDLQDSDADITLTGFDEPFIDEIIAMNEKNERENLLDIVPEPPVKPKSKTGELYQLGRHKLIVGDSTKPETYKRLLKTERADLVWTDPPYGVSYNATNLPKGKNWGVIDNDNLRANELQEFLTKAYTQAFKHTKDNTALYTCYASINHKIFEDALNTAGYIIKQQLIWEKGHTLGHSDYHLSHEPILYCKKNDQTTKWYGDRTHKTTILSATFEKLEKQSKDELINLLMQIKQNSDILSISRGSMNSYLHATQKPVELSRTMIKNSTKQQSIILEPFAGSGSVMIACETSHRTAYMIEINPTYADVILNRYKEFTGEDPTREDGVKWSKINK